MAEKDTVATTVSPAPSLDGGTKSGRSGGGRGRKKYLPFLDILFYSAFEVPDIGFNLGCFFLIYISSIGGYSLMLIAKASALLGFG